jgi:DNA-binding XRE family transcriptional regulator
MQTDDIFNLLHNAIEAQNFGRKISHKDMAKEVGVSMRTYQDWRLGNTKPQAVMAAFKMLSKLDEDEALRVIKRVKKELNGTYS